MSLKNCTHVVARSTELLDTIFDCVVSQQKLVSNHREVERIAPNVIKHLYCYLQDNLEFQRNINKLDRNYLIVNLRCLILSCRKNCFRIN